MKKLSFFLMAMLFSVMSFAAEASIDFSTQGYANQTAMKTVQVNDDVTITFAGGGNNNVPKYYTNGTAVRMYPKNSFTVTTTTGKLTKIVITFGSGDGTLSIASNVGSYASGTWTGEATSATLTLDPNATSGNRRIKAIAVTYGEVSADYVVEPSISGDLDFIESTEVSIAAGEGLKVYYTLDGTDPTNASPEYTAPFEVKETTTVKAIAYNGENASAVASKTFTKATQVTCAEAKEIALKVSGNNVPTELTYVVKGYVTNIVGDWKSGKQSFWIADTKDGGKVFEAYYCFISKAVTLGDYVQLFGKLTKYNTTPEMADGQATIIPAPVVNHTVTVTANAEGENVVSGGGEYEEGKEVTVSASEDLEGWVFIGWTEDGEFVANDPEYTFVVKGDVELVAVYAMDLGENKVTDLVIDGDNMLLTGSVADFQMGTMNLELALGEYDEEEGTYLLTEESKLYVGETNFTFVDGMATVDMNTNSAMAIVVFEYNGTYYYMTVNMSKKIEATIIEIADATVTIEERSMGFGDEVYHVLKMESTWSDGETTYPVLLETTEFDQTKESQEVAASIRVGGMGDEDPWLGNAEGDVTITVADGKVTVEGLLENAYALPAPIAFDVTISGTLPVEEPKVIAYELNGGEFPAVVVPTNEELAMAFKQEYAEYFAIEGLTDTDMNREVGNFIYVTNSKGGDAVKFITENANWKWLADYIISVAAAIPEGTNVGYYWRANIDAFFHCKNAVAVGGVNSADFSEAGKPENWGAAYEAAHAVVLPTEPVAEDYVLPTPVKEGYKFVGWYDNAAGAGDAYTVIPAGWAGTLYAIWEVEGPGTALENIAVEGKAVKAIVNGQLIIIKNGVQYNAQGQVVK